MATADTSTWTKQQWVDHWRQTEYEVSRGKSVSHDGKSWGLEDLAEVRRSRVMAERELAAAQGGTSAPRHQLADFS